MMWHVSPTGTATGNGSQATPWDLATAFKHPAAVKPGDTIIVHAGTYHGVSTSNLMGTPAQPIVVRGEGRATIDFWDSTTGRLTSLAIAGGHTIYRDLEIVSTIPSPRTTAIDGSWVSETNRGELGIRGPMENSPPVENVWLVNCVIHDLNNGVAHQHRAIGGGVYGCVIYNCGWQAPGRGHGHAVYVQNTGAAVKTVENNIVFNSYDDGLNVYGSAAPLINIHLLDNTAFGNGRRNLYYGGETVVKGAVIRGNVLATLGIEDTLGLGSPPPWGPLNEDIVIQGNYLVGAIRSANSFTSGVVAGNTIVGGREVRFLDWMLPTGGTKTFTGNRYIGIGGFLLNNAVKTLAEWKAAGFDADAVTQLTPTGRVFIRPNKYEPGRAHVTVINWERTASVPIDLSSVLSQGAAYTVHSAYSPFGPPLVSGTYTGPIAIPMGTVAAPIPIGATAPVVAADIRFQAFVVTSVLSIVVPPPPPPPPSMLYRNVLLGPDGRLYVEEAGTFREIKLQ